MTADPFADPDTAAVAESDDFLTNEELIGRNLIIVPKAIDHIPGEGTWPDGREKTDYDRITTDIIILDGRRNPKIKAFPQVERNKYISAYKVVAELRKYVGTGTPVLGYFAQVNKAYFLEPADDDAKKLAGPAWEAYKNGSQAQEPPF